MDSFKIDLFNNDDSKLKLFIRTAKNGYLYIVIYYYFKK